jgi:hypothetical protein
VYVFVTKGDVLVKRVQNKIREEKSVTLISDNAYYEPYDVKITEVVEIWYVRAKISPFLPSPSNVKTLIKGEMDELRKTIQNQSKVIENLYKTIETLVNK